MRNRNRVWHRVCMTARPLGCVLSFHKTRSPRDVSHVRVD